MPWTQGPLLKGPDGAGGAALALPIAYALPPVPKAGRVYSYPGQGAVATLSVATSVSVGTPFAVQGTCQPVSIGFEASTASTAIIRGALYARDEGGEITDLLADLGEVAINSVLGVKVFPVTPPALTAGLYAVVLAARTSSQNVRAITATHGPHIPTPDAGSTAYAAWTRTGTIGTGAWPSPWGAAAGSTNAPRIHITF
jgi:hypothetical protein